MVEEKLSKRIPSFDYGISQEDQEKIYNLDLKKKSS